MKKKFIITFAFFTLLALVFFSCRQDIGNLINPEAGISIADAQSWYESNKLQGVQLGFAKVKASKGKLNGKPDWKHAYKVDHPDFTTVQVPLSVQGEFCFVTPERQKAFEDTGDKRYIQSLTQMVVVNDKKTDKTTGFLMTIIPDKEYLEATNFKAFYSSYKKWQKGYSGLIFYHTLEGKFSNGWRFANGEVTRSITPKDDSGIDLQLKAPGAQKTSPSFECTDYYYRIWAQDCRDWYTITEYGASYDRTSCSSSYVYEYQYAYTSCYYSGGGGGDSFTGPGGVGSGASVPSSSANTIASMINLDSEGIGLFNKALDNLLTQCGYRAMYDYLTGIGVTFTNVSIDPARKTGGYDCVSGALTFRDNSAITNGLQEEFVHMFQNNYYSGGIQQYYYLGRANVEFEAKVIEDLLCTIRQMGCAYYGGTSSNYVDYYNWLDVVTNKGTYFPSYEDLLVRYPVCNNQNYSDFLNAFATDPAKPDYHFPVVETLNPQVLPFIKNNSCN